MRVASGTAASHSLYEVAHAPVAPSLVPPSAGYFLFNKLCKFAVTGECAMAEKSIYTVMNSLMQELRTFSTYINVEIIMGKQPTLGKDG